MEEQPGVFDPQVHPLPDAAPMIDPAISAIQEVVKAAMGEDVPEETQGHASEILEPNPPEFLSTISGDEQGKLLATALYGSDFPAIHESSTDTDWAAWARSRWDAHRGAVEKHLHLIERNRLFRAGQQWVSSQKGKGPWREPPKPVDSARLVYNLIDKALDQRLQVITDQRPGFRVAPMTSDPDDKRKAEARQMALEYQYDQQRMEEVAKESEYWAQTDGVAFEHTYWDSDAGAWDEAMDGKPLGDLRTQVLRCEQVRVSANATRTVKPYYVILREVIPASEAAYRYGVAGVQEQATTEPRSENGTNRWSLDQTTVGEGDRLKNQDTVERFTIYIDKQPDILPDGLQVVVVGDAVIWGPGPLLFKTIPVVAVRDGSSDPSYYPRPIMEQWLDHQVRINALISGAFDNYRVNKGGRFITRAGAFKQETMVGGGTSMLEVNGTIGSLDDVIKPMPGFSIGSDFEALFQIEIKAFEDASGYNDVSRGQIAGDASGRAILAAREQLERIFAPPVQARAAAYTEWAKVQISGMAFGYDVPRNLGTVGKGRPDLARALSAQDFDGVADVKVEAETLMPMPRTYRKFLLDELFDKGLITPQQYMRRQEWAITNDLDTPDEDQEARAQRICEAIRMREPVPEMRWQDNEAIHQDVLERQIILHDDLEQDIIAAAQQRWADLANQATQKQQGLPMGGPSPLGASAPAPGGAPPQLPPGTQPLPAMNPSVGAQPPEVSQFEQLSPQ